MIADTSKSSVTAWCSKQWRAVLSELLATLLLVLFGCMSTLPLDGFETQPVMYGPFGFGLIVLINVQIFGHISGAHMNPAVTLASVIWGSTSIGVAIAFVLAQCGGAILGYGILILVAHIDPMANAVCTTVPHANHTILQTLAVEAMLTVLLSSICCALWDPVNETKQDSVPIKFGLAIAGLSLAGAPLTGASMNPARSLGPAVWTGVWYNHWVYWVGPLLGAGIASFIYKYILFQKN